MSSYRYDTLTSKNIEWVSKSSQTLCVTVALVQEMRSFFDDDDYQPTTGGLSIRMRAFVDGADDCMATTIQSLPVGHKSGCVSYIGKVGLSKNKLDEVLAAIDEVKKHDAWVRLEEKRIAARLVEEEYDAHVRRVDDMMTLGGRTY